MCTQLKIYRSFTLFELKFIFAYYKNYKVKLEAHKDYRDYIKQILFNLIINIDGLLSQFIMIKVFNVYKIT